MKPDRSRVTVALAAGVGFLVGIVLIGLLTHGGGSTRTVTTAAPPAQTQPSTTSGGRIVKLTAVPDVVGDRLDIAKQRVRRAGFVVKQSGGGLFGVLRDHNWAVVAEDPTGGTQLELGSTVTLDIDRP